MGNENETTDEKRARLLREIDEVDAECAALLVDPVLGQWTPYPGLCGDFGTFAAPTEDVLPWVALATARLRAAQVLGSITADWLVHPTLGVGAKASCQVARRDLARLLATPVEPKAAGFCEQCGGAFGVSNDPRCIACAA